jgi:hypothetical protein
MRWSAVVLSSAVCHGPTLTPSGLLESLTPFCAVVVGPVEVRTVEVRAVEAEASGAANAVTAIIPAAMIAA